MKAYRADVGFDGERFRDAGVVVLVDGGSIVGVEPADAALPEGVDVVSFEGATLLPGLVDTHAHLCADNSPTALDQLADLTEDDLARIVTQSLHQQVAAGVTTVRDLGDRHWFVADHREPRLGLPRVLAAGPPITAAGGHCAAMGGEIFGDFGTRADALEAAVRERAERGADVVKIMASGGMMTPGTDPAEAQFDLAELRVVVETAHDLGMPVTAHAHALDAVRNALGAGVDGIEHCSCMTQQGPTVPPDVLGGLATSGVAVCPTSGRMGGDPPPRIQAQLDRFHLTMDDLVEHVATLWRGGVRLVGGDDAGINPEKPHGILPVAVEEFTGYGASVAEALATFTSVAADELGLGTVTGRLRAGLAADLLVVPGDVREGVAPLRTPSVVVVRGEAVGPPPPP